MTVSWPEVVRNLRRTCEQQASAEVAQQRLDRGQRASIEWIASRIERHGVVLADEVGTGKTRIACAIVHAVVAAGGRVAVVVPHGLMHQWRAESKALDLDAPDPKSFTTLTELFRRLPAGDRGWDAIASDPDTAEWCLVSHGFRAPVVKSGTYPWRYALSDFTELYLRHLDEAKNARTRWGKLKRLIDSERADERAWGTNGMARIARSVAPRIRAERRLVDQMESLPELNTTTWENPALIAAFANDGPGRALTEQLLGHWLGEFDLVVVDEAHKSRGAVERDEEDDRAVTGTVLARLLARVIRQSEGARRVCLTATPMELELSQWMDLLARAQCTIDMQQGHDVIERLRAATVDAATAPDEGARLDRLCAAAREFARTLAPFVTRRRRATDARVGEFRDRIDAPTRAAHPHRRVETVLVPWKTEGDTGAPWVDVLFAAECMSRSARGLPKAATAKWPHAVKEAYTKLAEGHISVDLLDAREAPIVPEAGTIDESTRRKIARTAYWFDRLLEARRRVGAEIEPGLRDHFDPDTEHPRVQAAVREIEKWTIGDASEKVLVFGVFLKPLRHLRDVLDAREALRCAASGSAIPRSPTRDPRLMAIAMRELGRMNRARELNGTLGSVSRAELERIFEDRHDAYEKRRRGVYDRSERIIHAMLQDPASLGAYTIDDALSGHLRSDFVAFVIDQALADGTLDTVHERLDELAVEFREKRLRPFLGEGEQDEGEKAAADRVAALRRAFEDEDSRLSSYARLLEGGTRWETRRYLQAAFNRPKAWPRVLIAQSQVGREGLNLHEQCRVVLQFHAEWNPAVLEQQIGRVDRKGSLWERRAKEWIDTGAAKEAAPFIEVRRLVFAGTYDAFKWSRVGRRQQAFDASLFGSLLSEDAWERVPKERLDELERAAPRFDPPHRG